MAVILNLAQTFYIMFMINPQKMSSLENKTKINVFVIYFIWKKSQVSKNYLKHFYKLRSKLGKVILPIILTVVRKTFLEDDKASAISPPHAFPAA